MSKKQSNPTPDQSGTPAPCSAKLRPYQVSAIKHLKKRHKTLSNLNKVQAAIASLRGAREFLVEAGCKKAAAAVRRALKSAEGAERNAYRFAVVEAAL